MFVSVGALGAIGYGRAKSVNWYPYYPKFVLMGKARADERLAVDELVRRVRIGLLPNSQIGDIVPLA